MYVYTRKKKKTDRLGDKKRSVSKNGYSNYYINSEI